MKAVVDVRCPKCGAGRVSLYKADRYLPTGSHLEEIVFRICSNILASRTVKQGRRA